MRRVRFTHVKGEPYVNLNDLESMALVLVTQLPQNQFSLGAAGLVNKVRDHYNDTVEKAGQDGDSQ